MKKTTLPFKLGIVDDMTSAEYHSTMGTWSSSQLKDMLEDPQVFYRKYVTKEIARETNPVFDVGTYFHTSLLEPEKLQLECAVYTGKRLGAAWDKFKLAHAGKAIITENEKAVAEKLVASVRASDWSMKYLSLGRPEISAFIEVLISGGEIYHEAKKLRLGLDGWERAFKIPSKGKNLVLKARADMIGDDFIQDLKSTQGNAVCQSSLTKLT